MSKAPSLIEVQEAAIETILALPTQGRRASGYGLTLLNRSGRSLTAIRGRFDSQLLKLGFTANQTAAAWQDVKDMAKLREGAQ